MHHYIEVILSQTNIFNKKIKNKNYSLISLSYFYLKKKGCHVSIEGAQKDTRRSSRISHRLGDNNVVTRMHGWLMTSINCSMLVIQVFASAGSEFR